MHPKQGTFFWDVVRGKMQLSEIGEIVKQQWLKTFDIRMDMNLEMDDYVVMPNHFHAIIYIGENKYNMERRDAMHCVSTTTATTTNATNKFDPQSKNLSSIIRGFKSAGTINARKIHAGFAWQSRYHDHIIRNDGSFQRIRNYISENPKKWTDDKFYGSGYCGWGLGRLCSTNAIKKFHLHIKYRWNFSIQR